MIVQDCRILWKTQFRATEHQSSGSMMELEFEELVHFTLGTETRTLVTSIFALDRHQPAHYNHIGRDNGPSVGVNRTREVTNTWLPLLANGGRLFLFVAAAPAVKPSWSGTEGSEGLFPFKDPLWWGRKLMIGQSAVMPKA